ncbi:MAG: bifunctional DNA-formamidopyrimidine glycosylase/DNA-(apurinic or apyrimidinic site) lyase [Alphaproteobacteria bacterium]|nr:bifunctional DNA-formamidopyrimidine glycosylase/DNA-(apurinic or apyrimidinic site) lyase [Alphaproteobacteria bacterium]
MPELPEVETVRRGLQPALEGTTIVSVEVRRGDLRFPLQHDFVSRLTGQRVVSLSRRAKYLLADLASQDVLVIHLGMSGSLRLGAALPQGRDEKHDHVRFLLKGGAMIVFNDPRRFGAMKVISRSRLPHDPMLADLGPEPLGNAFDAASLAQACAGKKTSLKAALLDQHVVAGLGNIYVCEALARAHLAPQRQAAGLALRDGKPSAAARRLVEAIRAVLLEAIAAGGSSLRDHRQASGEPGWFQHRFTVYGREGEPCLTPGCRGRVSRMVQNGRSSFWCATCQK